MKRLSAAILLSAILPLAYADGILERYGAGGSVLQRFGDQPQGTEILIINGQTYTAPAGTAARIRQQQEDERDERDQQQMRRGQRRAEMDREESRR
jgi:hypothetical protein